MVVCENCGNKGIFLAGAVCGVCGQKGCRKCDNFFPIEYKQELNQLRLSGNIFHESREYKMVNPWICSEQCVKTMQQRLSDYARAKLVEDLKSDNWSVEYILTGKSAGYYFLTRFELALSSVFPYLTETERSLLVAVMDRDLKDFSAYGKLMLAKHLEEVGLPHEAANIYDKYLKMYDKARELRTNNITIKKMTLTVDLNELLRQIRDGGIVAIYKCPHCGGKLKVGKDSTVEKMQICEYCSNKIETADLTEFLRDIVS